MNSLVFRGRQAFYRAQGPWWRAQLAEALGSQRFSHPGLGALDEALRPLLPERGVFLEAGAHDGFTQSNTYYLERFRGWSGILVEPVPQLARRAARRRPRSRVFNCALTNEARPGDTITLRFGDLMSVVSSRPGAAEHAAQGATTAGARSHDVTAPACTLTQVIADAGAREIDLMILDVEGHEMEVLHGLALPRLAPRLLVIEMLDMSNQRERFDEFLADYYQPGEILTQWDAAYRRTSG